MEAMGRAFSTVKGKHEQNVGSKSSWDVLLGGV